MPVQVSKILMDPVYDAIMHETLKYACLPNRVMHRLTGVDLADSRPRRTSATT